MNTELAGVKQMALTTAQVCSIAGVARQTLEYWSGVRKLCGATLLPRAGKRYPRYWSLDDLVLVRSIKALRDAGCSLQKVARVKELLEEQWTRGAGARFLYWDGSDISLVDDEGAVTALLLRPGQLQIGAVVSAVVLPLEAWRVDATHIAKPMDIVAIRAKRDARKLAAVAAAG